MNKYFLILLTFFALSSCEQDAEIIDLNSTVEKKPVKITICHYNKGNDTWKTIEINEKQLPRHLDHGDKIGPCGYTYIPDDGFEKLLILKGYDDILDNYVLTSNIENIKELWIPANWQSNDLYFENLIGLEDFSSLEDLYIRADLIDFPDLTKNKSLKVLDLMGQRTTSIDLTQNVLLTDLIIEGCKFEQIDVSKNTQLKKVSIQIFVPIETLDLSQNLLLEEIFLLGLPDIADLDFTANTNVRILTVDSMESLKSLNIKNGNNVNLEYVVLWFNPELTCIQVDDAAYSKANWTTYIDDWTTFSEDCGY